MNFSLVSDLHIDFCKCKNLDLPGGNILLLAGDLAEVGALNPKEQIRSIEAGTHSEEYIVSKHQQVHFLERNAEELKARLNAQLSKYREVISVLGNHEHYSNNFGTTLQLYREALPQVRVLDDEWIELDDGTILFGSTLWSDLGKGNPMVETRVSSWSDYKHIWTKTGATEGWRRLRAQDTLFAHKVALKALYRCLDANTDKNVIVMTHFTPTYLACHERYRMSLDNAFFHSNLEDIILDNPQIKAWCFGHTHDCFDFKIGDCRMMCNPRGYPGESKEFNPGFNFDIN